VGSWDLNYFLFFLELVGILLIALILVLGFEFCSLYQSSIVIELFFFFFFFFFFSYMNIFRNNLLCPPNY
jgi:hypothetical protein